MRYLPLIIAIFGVSAVQLLVKYRFNVAHGAMPSDRSLLPYAINLLRDPWLWGAAVLLIVAAVLWYFSISRLPLSVAIAFAALVYPTVILGSAVFLGEHVALQHAGGCVLIVAGIWTIAAYT